MRLIYATRLAVPLGVGFFVLLACGLTVALKGTDAVSAQAATCNVLMVIDKSGSVGQDSNNVSRMKAQMQELVTRLGAIPTDENEALKVQLGLWSFSSVIDPSASTNYNSPPSMGYSDTGKQATANAVGALTITPQGGTNYEQGFGYNGYAYGTQTINANAAIQSLAKNASIMVFMTDGSPNTPASSGVTGDNNATALRAAKSAYKALKTLNPNLAGFTEAVMVGSDTNAMAMNYIINASDSANPPAQSTKLTQTTGGASLPHIYYTSAGYTGLSDILYDVMKSRCEDRTGVTPGDPYSLNPTVTNSTNNDSVTGETTATFSYNVDSTIPSGSTSSSGWKVSKLVVPKGQPANSLMFGERGNCGYNSSDPSKSTAYCDGIPDCSKLATYIGGTGGGRSCSDVASGTNSFGHGPNSLDQYAKNALVATLDGSYPVGTKLCFVLIVHKPTNKSTPLDRASRASCLTVGKKPSVQIHGGDLRVGRLFMTDSAAKAAGGASGPSATPAAVINTSVTAKSDGKSYGSWVEYGAFAPGAITGIASMSGLAGGYPSNQPNSQRLWSKLTFANAQGKFGYFTEANSGQGTIPDYATAILASRNTVKDMVAEGNLTLKSGENESGVYQKLAGDLTVNDSTLGKGETVVIYVPNGTVTIAGNIAYDDGPYGSVAEIPQLVIIAKTIAIQSNVVNIDSWLIANSAADGTVTTCNDPATLTVNVCSQRLTINGPVIAHYLDLRRTGGSENGVQSADPAEVISLPGSSYLWAQYAGQSDVRAQTTLTTELPPYF